MRRCESSKLDVQSKTRDEQKAQQDVSVSNRGDNRASRDVRLVRGRAEQDGRDGDITKDGRDKQDTEGIH